MTARTDQRHPTSTTISAITLVALLAGVALCAVPMKPASSANPQPVAALAVLAETTATRPARTPGVSPAVSCLMTANRVAAVLAVAGTGVFPGTIRQRVTSLAAITTVTDCVDLVARQLRLIRSALMPGGLRTPRR